MTRLTVHKFRLGDVDDPEIYAGQPLYQWEKSEQGQWVMEHAIEQPMFYIKPDVEYAGYNVTVVANLTEEDSVLYALRWS